MLRRICVSASALLGLMACTPEESPLVSQPAPEGLEEGVRPTPPESPAPPPETPGEETPAEAPTPKVDSETPASTPPGSNAPDSSAPTTSPPEPSTEDERPTPPPMLAPTPAPDKPTPDDTPTPEGDGGAPPTPAMQEQQPVSDVLLELQTILATAPNDRPALSGQPTADQPLSQAEAEAARMLLWEDFQAQVEAARNGEHQARTLRQDELSFAYDYTVFGAEPPDGHSLFISLHGGGQAPPSVNDQQWENQKVLYQPAEGIYLAPRAPTNTWNLWHEAHVDVLLQRLIQNFIVMEGVNPNRIYLMGYSAGGDGVYQLGPRMADYWAAAAAMAGHPNEAKPLSLRNIGFTVHVGGLDTAFDRNVVAEQWGASMAQLQADDPEGYPHHVEVHPGKPHWLDLEDAVAVPWMSEFERTPWPNVIVWYQDDITHDSFYWLAVDEPKKETLIRATLAGQRVSLETDDLSTVTLRFRDEMLDLDQPVVVEVNGQEVHNGVVPRTISALDATLTDRGDPSLLFSAQLKLSW